MECSDVYGICVPYDRGMVVQKDFERIEPARAYFNQLLAEKPYEGVMVMLLRKESYYRTFLVDADVIQSTIKPAVPAAGDDAAGLEAGMGA